MLNKYFPVNEYHTPKTQKRVIWDKLSLGTSFYFNLKFMYFLYKNRKLALNNQYDTERWALSSFEILKHLEDCGAKFHIEGFEHVDAVKDEPVIFVSNHMSTLETMVFPCLVAPVKEATFVVKDTLTTSNVFGPVMRARNPIAVGRNDSRQDLIKVLSDGKQKLAEGTSIIIFPQSTRSNDFNPEKFNSLGVKLAQKSKVRVVPMAIKTDLWANGKLIKDMGSIKRKKPVHIKFGTPLTINGSGKDEHQFIVDFIKKNLEEWNK
ncbi:MAG: lysophospholipid acyltransferase family protein [Prolixibacteraceae bacterium]|jgi:1-acyl-sn-glycerol-3-phosphate acyltransferase|nr:lysophospholipid acyltransferase family protein [Prolixibacteraceae bacterium]